MTPTQTYWKGRPTLYRVFDRTGRLIYVGQSVNLPSRLSEHRGQSWWWRPLAHRVRVELHPTAEAAKAAEKTAIQEETPVFNSMGYGNWRQNPYWSETDHQLYRDWYRQILRKDGYDPKYELQMLNVTFPGETNRGLWLVS